MLESVRESSMSSCMLNPLSGLTFGKETRSGERTKKFPWNVWIETPDEKTTQDGCEPTHSNITVISNVCQVYLLINGNLPSKSGKLGCKIANDTFLEKSCGFPRNRFSVVPLTVNSIVIRVKCLCCIIYCLVHRSQIVSGEAQSLPYLLQNTDGRIVV